MSIGGCRRHASERVAWIGIAALIGLGSLGALAKEVSNGDAAWSRRAEGEREGRPLPAPILEAARAYERALAAHPENVEARWKLLRALHFAGDFAALDPTEEIRIFDRARSVSEEGLVLLNEQVGTGRRLEKMEPQAIEPLLDAAGVSPRNVARLYFWSAINLGAWSRNAGLLTAVRQGLANRLHRYTLITIALEPGYDDGGALRLLGRLHAELPRVPFVSSWVRRDQSIPLLERASAMAPEHPGNRLLLALTLLDLAPEREREAIELLERVEALSPRPTMLIEDLAMREEARKQLAALRAEETT